MKQIIGSSVFLAGLWVVLFFSFLFVGKSLWWPVRIGMLVIAVVLLVRVVRFAVSKPKYFIFACVIVAINWVVIELAAVVFERGYLAKHPVYGRGRHLSLSEEQRVTVERRLSGDGGFYRFDPLLGWAIIPNGDNGIHRANSRGMRGDREYEESVPEGVTRVICCGDSYTFCAEVENGETWQEYAEGADEGYEFLNLGLAAAGLAQAYVRYRELGSQFESDYVFIGYMTNNIQRTVNVFRPFLYRDTGAVAAKPYAALDEEGELVVHPNPLDTEEKFRGLLDNTEEVLAELGEKDYYVQLQKRARPLLPSGHVWRYLSGEFGAGNYVRKVFSLPRKGHVREFEIANDYLEGSYPLEVVSRLFDQFVEEVEANGARPVIVIFPNREDMDDYNEGKPKGHATLLERLDEAGHEYIDVLDLMVDHYGDVIPDETMFVESHYNGETNRLLGLAFLDYLRGLSPDGGEGEPGGE
ncbi:MAG: hypothetical protein AAF591_02310 [Verrucomicrobiota bacterium]